MRSGKIRGKYKASKLKNLPILTCIKELKSRHPFWGYRRVKANLKARYRLDVSYNRVYRIMQENDLLYHKNNKLKAVRTPKDKPRATEPNQFWGIDMTKVLTPTGWVYITIVLDWYTKKVVGYHAGQQSKAADWLYALDMGLNRQFKNGSRGCGLRLISDNGCQPTSVSFMRACGDLGVEQIFTSYCNPKGNADTERFMRTLKEECCWLCDWRNSRELEEELKRWIEEYNAEYLHSSLGYISPNEKEQAWNKIPKLAA